MKAVNIDDVLKILYKYDKYIFVTDRKRYSNMVDEIANIKELQEPCTVTGFADRCRECGAKYGKLLKQTNWIPVSERLPEKSGYFLVSVFDNKYEVAVVEDAWFAHKNEYDDIEESEWRELGGDGTVIAWMPLPEPYKEESEKK